LGYANREIELKFLVEGALSIEEVDNIIQLLFPTSTKISGISKDTYWAPSRHSDCDFTRLRHRTSNDEKAQVTIKKTHRGSNLNRIEIDVEVEDASNMYLLLNHALGKPKGEIIKDYRVYFLNKHKNVSTYQIIKDNKIFIEIEALNSDEVRKISRKLKDLFKNHNMNIRKVSQSLYQLFVLKEKMK